MILNVLNDGGNELSLAHDGFDQLLYLPEEISNLEKVQFLDLTGSKVEDLTPIAKMTGLRYLRLGSSSITSISALSEMKVLTRLEVSNTAVSDLTPLQGCTSLSDLDASGTRITSIEPLKKLSRLRTLRLSDSRLKDISPLKNLNNLQYLDIARTPVADIRPIQHIAQNLIQKEQEKRKALNERILQEVSQKPKDDRSVLSSLMEQLEIDDFGFSYKLTEATALDPELSRLSKLGPSAVSATLDYLETLDDHWPPISIDTPEQDTLLSVAIKDQKIELALKGLSHDQLDPIQKAVLPKLRVLCSDLEKVSGNQFHRLTEAARNLSTTLAKSNGLPDAILIHIEIEALRSLIDNRSGLEEFEDYSPDLKGIAAQLFALGPSLTMGDPNVQEMEKRIADFHTPRVASQATASNEMMQAVLGTVDTFGRDLKAVTETLAHAAEIGSPRLISGRISLSRNILVVAGTAAAAGIATGAMGQIGAKSVDFLLANTEAVKAVALYYGGSFQTWLLAILQHLPEVASLRGAKSSDRS